MAETRFARSDALTAEFWSRMLEHDIVYRTDLAPLIGPSANSVIQLKTETGKDRGDKITYPLMAKLTGDGFTEGQVATGNAESLSLYTDSITVNELGHVVDIPNDGRSIDAQRVPVNLRQAARWGLATWYGERMSVN